MGGIYPRSNKFVSELLHVVFIEKSVSSFSVVNKIGSTTVRLQCGEGDATLISQQLSHSIHTQARHYEGIVGSVHAANAFRTKEALRGRRMNKKAVSCTRVNRYQKVNSYRRDTWLFCHWIGSQNNNYPFLLTRVFAWPPLHNRDKKQIQDKVKNMIKFS